MKYIRILLLTLLPLVTFGQMQQVRFDASAGNGQQIDAAGHRLSAAFFLPKNYDGKTRLPLIISFHGAGEASAKMVLSQLFANGLPKNINQGLELQAIVMAPQDQWSTPAPAAVDYMVRNYVLKNYAVDTARIYTTGYSYGGMGAVAAAISLPYIAAVVSLSPSPLQDSSVKKISALAKNDIPVAWWYQPNDPGTPSQADVQQYGGLLTAAGGSSLYVVGTPAGQHGPWDPVYTGKVLLSGRTFDQWLFQYSKPASTAPPGDTIPVPSKKLLLTIKVYNDGTTETITAQ